MVGRSIGGDEPDSSGVKPHERRQRTVKRPRKVGRQNGRQAAKPATDSTGAARHPPSHRQQRRQSCGGALRPCNFCKCISSVPDQIIRTNIDSSEQHRSRAAASTDTTKLNQNASSSHPTVTRQHPLHRPGSRFSDLAVDPIVASGSRCTLSCNLQ